MKKLKKILVSLTVITAVISSISSMAISSSATQAIYKSDSGYKYTAMGATHGVTMSYTIDQNNQKATAKYQFDTGSIVPNGTKKITIYGEYILPKRDGATSVKTLKNSANKNSTTSTLSTSISVPDTAKSQGYKLQYVDIAIDCTSDSYTAFWIPSYR